MTDIAESRRFWEKTIASIEVIMFIGMGFILYFIAGILANYGINFSSFIALLIQATFAGMIIYLNKSFMAELNRRLPIPKRNYAGE